MSLRNRLSDTGRKTIRKRLVAEVGGYLRNVVREPHVTCAVCATPIKPAFELADRAASRVAAVAAVQRVVVTAVAG